jgi:ribosomal protein S18 acetylase RimI-like enzyme
VISIRAALPTDAEFIWELLEPAIAGGEVFAIAPTASREEGLAYWMARSPWVFVAEIDGQIVGSYFLRPNQGGGGAHVANCGYATAEREKGRGVASIMCAHSLEFSRQVGFRAMQFNFVVSSNAPAVHLWQKHGFAIAGRLPGAFLHPRLGYVDALVMYREL